MSPWLRATILKHPLLGLLTKKDTATSVVPPIVKVALGLEYIILNIQFYSSHIFFM